jgi:site-specific DNA recombinase
VHNIANAAPSTGYRYRYYTCFSRQRYGTASCSAERLPADQLESEVRGALLRTVRHHDLEAALAAGLARPVRSAVSTETSSAWWTPS